MSMQKNKSFISYLCAYFYTTGLVRRLNWPVRVLYLQVRKKFGRPHVSIGYLKNRGGEFLKKLWRCVVGVLKDNLVYQLS